KSRMDRVSAVLILLGLLLVLYYLGVNWLPKWYRELTYHQSLEIVDTSAQPFTPLRLSFEEDSYFRLPIPATVCLRPLHETNMSAAISFCVCRVWALRDRL
ncbi:MAG: hypothetical protein RSF90_01640, partial [Pygmaiobacter sp.]